MKTPRLRPSPSFLTATLVTIILSGCAAQNRSDADPDKIACRATLSSGEALSAEACQATRVFTTALKDAIEKGEARRELSLPTSPVGEMLTVVYQRMVVPQVTAQRDFDLMLQRTGWRWVWTPESVRSTESLDESRRRIAELKDELRKLITEGDSQAQLELTLNEMSRFRSQTTEAEKFYANFSEILKRNGPEAFDPVNKQGVQLLTDHILALDRVYEWLQKRPTIYTVDDEMHFAFKPGTTDRERAEFEGRLAAIDVTGKKLRENALAQADMAARWVERMDSTIIR